MNNNKVSFFKYIIYTIKASMIFTLSLTLLSVGILISSFFTIQKAIIFLQESTPAKIVFNADYTANDLNLLDEFLLTKIKDNELIKSTFVSKEQGLIDVSEILGDDFEIFYSSDSLSQNPLPDIQNIYINSSFHNDEYYEILENKLSEFNCISYFQPPLNILKINHWKNNILVFSSIFAFIFFIISVLLIYNNIKLTFYNNRANIKTMQLVGATKSFILRPYIINSIWIGLISGILSVAIITLLFYITYLYVPSSIKMVVTTEIVLLFCIMIFLGIVISFISTFIVLNKLTSLKTDINE